MNAFEAINAVLSRGAVEEVSDEGTVVLRLPSGERERLRIPLEQVLRVRASVKPRDERGPA